MSAEESPLSPTSMSMRDFGTGCVKITPAHDPNDFEVGKRHGLEVLDMLTDDAKITDDYPAYAGMDRYEARKKIVADLEEQGCLISVEDHVHNVGHLLPLRNHCRAEGFASVVRQNGAACASRDRRSARRQDKVRPREIREKLFPLDGEYPRLVHLASALVGTPHPRVLLRGLRRNGGRKGSSRALARSAAALRSLRIPTPSTHGSPRRCGPSPQWAGPTIPTICDRFYPTSTLVTGYDIITFWVSRMIFSGLEYTGKIPFDTVLIHGLVRDAAGTQDVEISRQRNRSRSR